MAETMSNKSNDYKRDAQNDEIKSIVLGLFGLIAFIIIVYFSILKNINLMSHLSVVVCNNSPISVCILR